MTRIWTLLFGFSAFALSIMFASGVSAQVARTYVETFDGPDPSVMLNGVVDYGADGDWAVRIDDGALELSNTEEGDAVRYYTTPTVSYPGSGRISRTDGATIEVDVRVDAGSRAGAGLIGGFDHQKKDYILFAVGPAQQVYVLGRTNGKAKILVATHHDAVRTAQTNRLKISREGGGLRFEVNDSHVLTIDREDVPGPGIGLGAFGRGSFSFDNVNISDPVLASQGQRPRDLGKFASDKLELPKCDLPVPTANAKIVVFGTYEGQALSSVALAGLDKETTATEFLIEEGPDPLYVVINSRGSMLSVFTGATDRVEQLVLLSSGDGRRSTAGTGVAGIERQRTVFGERCAAAFHELNTVAAITARSFITKALGRAPDAVFGSYDAARVTLPSGGVEKSRAGSLPAPAGFDAEVWREGSRFYPAGLLQVPIDKIVSQAEPLPYDILPSKFGMAQLIGSGAIEKMPDGAFKIVKPIAHYPASLSGAHAVTFVLAAGIPNPGGDPGHSCVFSEESGEMVARSAHCRSQRMR
jgi:hypothetical protein